MLLTACAGHFLVVLDVSVVNVALPAMRADLGLSPSGLQWVVNTFSIAFAGFMLLGGRTADLIGRRRAFFVGLALFTAASLAAGLAQEGWQLLLARTVQGLGAAVLGPATLTLVTTSVAPGPARTRAIGTWSAVGAAGGAAGGLVGGVLLELSSWRWVMLINVPAGALLLLAALLWITEGGESGGRRLDLPGAVLVTSGLALVAYGVVQTEESGWGAPATLAPVLGGLAALALFVLVEARTRNPLVPLGLFRSRAVVSANVTMALCGSASLPMWFFVMMYAQNALGFTPLEAGLALIPSSVAVVAGSALAPGLMARAGSGTVAAGGLLLSACGYAWQSTMTEDGTFLGTILGPGILMMTGVGLAVTPLAAVATEGAAPGESGLLTGLITTARTMGGALGLAALSTVAAARTGDSGLASEIAAGYALAFRIGACLMLTAAVLSLLWLPRRSRP